MARGWSQEEVAARMEAYGHDFHQTMIAKIEAAQRPLRVRELADFAALYGVEVQDLVYPPTTSLSETDQEIAEVTTKRDMARALVTKTRQTLEAASQRIRDLEKDYQMAVAEVVALEGRLESLQAMRPKLIGWESDEDWHPAEANTRTGRGALEPMRTSTAGGPTVLRILLGAQLRRLREAKRITATDAGRAIRASQSKIMRLEAGRLGFKERDISDLLTLYGVTDEQEHQSLRWLAQRANTPGWWHDFSDILPPWFEAYVGLEEVAANIRIYETQFVPGLLQTEDYARAVIRLGHDTASAKEIDRRVRLRMARQAVLDRPYPPTLWAVIDEAVVRRQIGDSAVMRDQLNYLADMAERPNVSVKILPFQARRGPAAGGPFSILRFAEPDLPEIVYLEQLTNAVYLDEPKDVDTYQKVIDRLGNDALTSHDTARDLRHLLKQSPPRT
jgi:transcriptional regulator with XRE-family HTH domain